MTIPSILHESSFEDHITAKLAEAGWQVSNSDEGFDPHTALYGKDFFTFLENFDPQKLTAIKDSYSGKWEKVLKEQLVKTLESQGTAWVLQNGFPLIGFDNVQCSARYPDPRLPESKQQYEANILRVMRQVHYQTAGNKSLDLVFFINGIPVATAELKTENTQGYQAAIKQYQKDRKPFEEGFRRKNYLLMPKRGAIVHFAISEKEIWMCTNLDGKKPKFLPFNMGNDGHAGNPVSTDGDYPTSYFWKQICQKDNWLRIFHSFVFNEVTKRDNGTGKQEKVSRFIFPRFHQWDCVTRVLADAKLNGPGAKYLIEHSAGSGKTQTISWVASELADLRNSDGQKMFSSVVIVTDRVSLDENIKKTISQLKRKHGRIVMVGNPDGSSKSAFESKSKQLAKAIAEKREIIVVTLQTFLYAWVDIVNATANQDSNFAVIIDEAHSSQSGSSASAMHRSLGTQDEKGEITSLRNTTEDETTPQDKITDYFLTAQKARTMPKNVSFLAFTATPKAETKTLFGRTVKNPETGEESTPQSFHLYPMRQAIEEGYILDPLTGYLPYKTAYQIADEYVSETVVDEERAKRKIAKRLTLHPTNVMWKAEFIIEHFVNNVASLLGHEAKGMIVCSSRPAVIRYKYAIDAYLKAHPEYDRSKVAAHIQFKVPGTPLVAFSDSVRGDQCIVTEDAMLEDNPFATIQKDYDYTESNMNDLNGYGSVEQAFDDPKNKLLIVANKFQTGFDQPKLCALYIDKKLSNDIEVVQTYSRVNRTYPGKDQVFIVDFVNDPEKVLAAFKKYDSGAEMTKPQDMYIVHDIKKELDEAGIYGPEDIAAYAKAKGEYMVALMSGDITPKMEQRLRATLYDALDASVNRWQESYLSANNAVSFNQQLYQSAVQGNDKSAQKETKENLDKALAELATVIDFRKKLKRYVSAYSFISQVVFLGDADLEIFNGFAKLLSRRLHGADLGDIDIGGLVLSDYKVSQLDVPKETPIEGKLRPMGAGGDPKASKWESLRVIVQQLNTVWGADVNLVDAARAVNFIADHVSKDKTIQALIKNTTNTKDSVVSQGRLASLVQGALLSLINNDLADLAEQALKDPQSTIPLTELIYDQIATGSRYEIADLQKYIQKTSKTRHD